MTSLVDQPIPTPDPHVIFPLMISFGSDPGLTFYTFPKHHFTSETEIKNLYAHNIASLESTEKTRTLTRDEKYQLENLKHSSQLDPRYRDICYGTLQDTIYAIEAATNLDSYTTESYINSSEYLCDWYKCYDFESTCRVDTPEFAGVIRRIVNRKRKPFPKHHYSDYHFLPNYKVELLPGDQIGEKFDVLTKGDRLIVVTRAIGDPTFSKWALKDSLEAITAYQTPNIEDRLSEMIEELNRSYLTFMGNPEEAPHGGAMVLVIYIKENLLTLAQVGPINIKHKVNDHYQVITQDHTFNNLDERARTNRSNLAEQIYSLAKSSGFNIDCFTTAAEAKYLLVPNMPSRFIGHPDYNIIGENSNPVLISAMPFINTINLEKYEDKQQTI